MSDEAFDLVVAGSGGAGLAAAVIAHSKGLKVLVVEKTGLIGGTTSYSGGVVWVPNSRQNVASGVEDTLELAELYLDTTVGVAHEREARRRYLERGAEAFAYLEDVTGPMFYVRASNSPDYYPDAQGASTRGRAMTPISFDGRLLGERFVDLRAPLPEFALFGRQMLELMDVFHLLNTRRSLRSALHTGGLLLRDVRDRVFHRRLGRGSRLTGGNALVGRLYRTLLDLGVPIYRDTPLVDLLSDETGVKGVVVERDGRRSTIAARKGVILATGGFAWGETLRKQRMKEAPVGYSAANPESKGDGISIALAHGARLDQDNKEGAFWAPVSVLKRRDGSTARFPHLMADRAKPGLIAINKNGVRFVNEAENYHDFVRAMMGRKRNEDQQPVYLICDAGFVRKYAFGAVPPVAWERRRAVRSGYLLEGLTIEELASKMGLEPSALRETIERFNQDARRGEDPEFGKGSTLYNRYLGDATHGPNPCLGPIERGPFYAIRVYAGDIGTTHGLSADSDSRVLKARGDPVAGLYACGSDRNSIMAGEYPGGGITIGPAITFAYLAVLGAIEDAAAPRASVRPQPVAAELRL